MADLVTKLVSLALNLFFAAFWLGVAAYVMRRLARWLFATSRQSTIATAGIIAAFVLAWVLNRSNGAGSSVVGLLRSNGGIYFVSPVVWAISGLVAAVAGYFLLTAVGRQYFTGRYRAEAAAAAIVVAAILGGDWPRGQSTTMAVNAFAPPSEQANAVAEAHDVSSICATARLVDGVGKGNLDGVRVFRETRASAAGPIALRRRDELHVNGWAAEANLARPALGACPIVDGTLLHDAHITYGASRPDVGSAFGKAALVPSAFDIVLPAYRIAPGSHRLQIAAVSADGAAMIVPGSATIVGP